MLKIRGLSEIKVEKIKEAAGKIVVSNYETDGLKEIPPIDAN